jgi:hypothetical protein
MEPMVMTARQFIKFVQIMYEVRKLILSHKHHENK